MNLVVIATTAAGLVVLTASCQDATQLTLDISTNAKCHDELKSTAIYVGSSLESVNGKLQTGAPVAQTDACNSGEVGTLVVTPGNSQGAVTVVGGFYGKSPTDCVEGHYENCIIARRSFTFIKHQSLTIPIPLERNCLNVPCSATTTCHNGACYDAAVECSGNSCPVPGTEPDAGSVDAGPMAIVEGGGPPVDGSTITGDDSGSDSGETDASGGVDGSDDGSVSATPDAGGGSDAAMPLACRSDGMGGVEVGGCNGQTCAAGTTCCNSMGGALGCYATATCLGANTIYCCNDTDCPGSMCCTGGGLAVASPPPPPILGGVKMGCSEGGLAVRAPNTTPGSCK